MYREGRQRVEVTVTDRTKLIANGVEARVVRDEVTLKGVPVEITDDYYAQDPRATSGTSARPPPSTRTASRSRPRAPSRPAWTARRPGSPCPPTRSVGMRYRQEYYKGHAEDRAKVVSLRERVKVPLQRYRNTLMTLETNPLEPDVLEAKFYARGVGLVLAVDLSGGGTARS